MTGPGGCRCGGAQAPGGYRGGAYGPPGPYATGAAPPEDGPSLKTILIVGGLLAGVVWYARTRIEAAEKTAILDGLADEMRKELNE